MKRSIEISGPILESELGTLRDSIQNIACKVQCYAPACANALLKRLFNKAVTIQASCSIAGTAPCWKHGKHLC